MVHRLLTNNFYWKPVKRSFMNHWEQTTGNGTLRKNSNKTRRLLEVLPEKGKAIVGLTGKPAATSSARVSTLRLVRLWVQSLLGTQYPGLESGRGGVKSPNASWAPPCYCPSLPQGMMVILGDVTITGSRHSMRKHWGTFWTVGGAAVAVAVPASGFLLLHLYCWWLNSVWAKTANQ